MRGEAITMAGADSSIYIAPTVGIPDVLLDANWVVGAVIFDGEGRAFAQRRSYDRKLFPGCWDVVGGHVETGEGLLIALARELHEETGWTLHQVLASLGTYEWSVDSTTRHEA